MNDPEAPAALTTKTLSGPPSAQSLEVLYTQKDEDGWIARVPGLASLTVTGRQFLETRRRLRRRLRGQLGSVPMLCTKVELLAPMEAEFAAFAEQYQSLHAIQSVLAGTRLSLAKRARKLGLPPAWVAERLFFPSAERLTSELRRAAIITDRCGEPGGAPIR